MSRKVSAQISILVLMLLAFFGIPVNARAGGVCGGTYIVDPGDTLEKLAAKCGTSVTAIYAANPGISKTLYTGQVLTIPGINYTVSKTPIPVTGTNYNPAVGFSGSYTVQYGDTFSGIAYRFGVTIQELWTTNPSITNINLLYVGQVIYVPASSQTITRPASTQTPTTLSYGTVPNGTPHGIIELSNRSKTDVYISLQGTTRDGYNVINEYPVSGIMKVKVPAGWYVYVAWVGGQKFVGQFNLGGGSEHSITFYSNKIVIE